MLTSFSQSPDWLSSEPFMFEDVQNLMKELDYLPTPPQSPPMKAGQGAGKPLSKEDQLSYVSDILLEDQDLQLLNWTCDFFNSDSAEKEGDSCLPCSPLDEATEDTLWQCLSDRNLEEKLVSTVLGSSPLLSDIDTSIFEDIVGSTLNCQDLIGAQEQQSEATSDYGSAGGEMSMSSSSDSEEEIDVVSVGSSSPSPLPEPSARKLNPEEEQRAIQLQHNYAAPCPASPPPSSTYSHKRSRGSDGSSRFHHATRSFTSHSSLSRYHCSSRSSTETEDEEERRRTHNVMERQRRNELKNCFMRLRDNVPELSHNDKASKVVILKKARDCICGLESESHRLRARKDKLRARQEELKARLAQLRR
ncbi:PREDICTED: transcriptional regulator Myc-A-like [Cyprinodon variegatus]|uniref:Transcriptional regulator n=1 Tax=Cyprinodon variegatus TaxID=28743 RepID=A0A3Q2C645_CYPVA|nr:PREDICTED: transcriptional regulator Myc-A-like [Cyprinodon variegatus]